MVFFLLKFVTTRDDDGAVLHHFLLKNEGKYNYEQAYEQQKEKEYTSV